MKIRAAEQQGQIICLESPHGRPGTCRKFVHFSPGETEAEEARTTLLHLIASLKLWFNMSVSGTFDCFYKTFSGAVKRKVMPQFSHPSLSTPRVMCSCRMPYLNKNISEKSVQCSEHAKCKQIKCPSLSTISRTFSLSFQSSFHLSITVLVRYRSLANI